VTHSRSLWTTNCCSSLFVEAEQKEASVILNEVKNLPTWFRFFGPINNIGPQNDL